MSNTTPKNTCQNWTRRRLATSNVPCRVLVVDDYPGAAEALVAFFSLEGLNARFVLSGEEAMSAVETWLPEIIVLDIHMPKCDGFTTATLLRSNATTSGVGVVAFTAIDADAVLRRASSNEFDGYCQKSSPPSLLLGLMNEMW